ncbi:hypothetical protein D0Z07_9127 [Hyphodiscus hymeniophilus]|uniref:SnoaL-like domain-containing protein n=1 Tax=Hyphodiscus hymeniophilus TaxID=353542 RepID=A0A9P6SL39_9HELO|nr:hypothetical protein D0Z07_9127 [Hyphodiscus hymeniophilus]
MPSTNATTLDSMWKHMTSLTPTSSPSTIQAITTFFSPTAIVHLNGMSQPPCTSHAELIASVQTLVTYWSMEELKVVTHVESADGKVIVNTMDNKLRIKEELVEGFKECEVVTFDAEGRIERYDLFVDPSPVVAVFARLNAAK